LPACFSCAPPFAKRNRDPARGRRQPRPFIRLFLTESALLALLGGDLVSNLRGGPSSLPYVLSYFLPKLSVRSFSIFTLDGATLGLTLAVTLATGLYSVLVPRCRPHVRCKHDFEARRPNRGSWRGRNTGFAMCSSRGNRAAASGCSSAPACV